MLQRKKCCKSLSWVILDLSDREKYTREVSLKVHGIRGRFEFSVCTFPFALKALVGVLYLQHCHKQSHCISFFAKRQFEQRSELGLWIRCTKVCVASQDAEPQRVIWITLSFFPGRTTEANGQTARPHGTKVLHRIEETITNIDKQVVHCGRVEVWL